MWLGLHKKDIWYFYDYICIICIISDLLNKCQTMILYDITINMGLFM